MGLVQKIVLVTSGQPSLNPRLVKEADALAHAGYEVLVIYQYWNDWGTQLDIELLKQKKWNSIRIGGNPKTNKLIYWKSRIMHKIANILAARFGYNYALAEQSITRGCVNLICKAKKLKADLYIAHNLGALPAAVLAAKKYHGKCGFDAEDFHRQEVTNDNNAWDFKLKKFIEDKYFPKIDYLTTASPLITEKYERLYPLINPKTILNVFPYEKNLLEKNGEKLKLFWFSQTIGGNRGLEQIISSLAYQDNIELHLLGYSEVSTQQYFNQLAKKNFYKSENIFYYNPIPPDEIIKLASQFDIGLATETGVPLNRDICLTNKIFTYIQSGLSLIVSDTTAQKQLLEEYPDMGMVYKKNNPDSLAQVLQAYINDQALLLKHQQQAYQYAEKILNWEVEKEKFLSVIKKTLDA
ncbi:hypothetical protein [Pedobacter miscanthi]|uniref:hypothetical protein n=1 Tax=Pedobacter miscanthi TaxID=2259170 RepID=UPI00292E4345|nr:hypothetical protein [Pedobacter miscanthi]